jgi:hypothetical protein
MPKHHPNYVPPYNTGKVKIGLHYVPPQRDYNTPESLRMQRVLLRQPAPKPQPKRPRLQPLLRRWIPDIETAGLLVMGLVVLLTLTA